MSQVYNEEDTTNQFTKYDQKDMIQVKKIYKKIAFNFGWFCVDICFFILATMTSDFEGFLSRIVYMTFFTYLNS